MTTVELGVARVPGEKPVYVSAELQLVDRLNDPDAMKQTTDHREIRRGDVPSISITWTYGTKAELARGDGSGGAGIDDEVLAAMVYPERGRAERIREFADRWHLNTMTPACIHQSEEWRCTGRNRDHLHVPQGWKAVRERYGAYPYPRRGDQCTTCSRNRWDEPGDACPETGYRWGTAWLMEIPPAEVIAELLELFGEKVPA